MVLEVCLRRCRKFTVAPLGPAVEDGGIEKIEGRGGVGHVAIESADAVEVGSVG